MKKYDCSKTTDFAHEAERMCHFYVGTVRDCSRCPMAQMHCDIDAITPKVIEAVQKWSDEHPEKPKLSQAEYIFVEMFHPYDFPHYIIRRNGVGQLFVSDGEVRLKLNPWKFQFIQPGKHWSLEELLELEVEDE